MRCGLHGLNQIGNILAVSPNGTPCARFKKSANWVKFTPVVGLGTRDKTYLHNLKGVGQLALVGPCVLDHRRPDQIGSKAVCDNGPSCHTCVRVICNVGASICPIGFSSLKILSPNLRRIWKAGM